MLKFSRLKNKKYKLNCILLYRLSDNNNNFLHKFRVVPFLILRTKTNQNKVTKNYIVCNLVVKYREKNNNVSP